MFIVIFQRVLYYFSLGNFPPPFVSAVVVIREGNKVLLIERSDGLGLSLPGGFVKLREKIEDAAQREVKEETGLDIEISNIIALLSGERRGTKIYSVDVVYEGIIKSNYKLSDSFEGSCKWINIENINQYKIALDYSDVLSLLTKFN